MRSLIVWFAGLFLVSFFYPSSLLAKESYTVSSFDSEIVVSRDQTLEITEIIKVDFGQERHGIYRNIPELHTSGGLNIKTPIEVVGVRDEEGGLYQYEVTTKGGDKRIKIGDPDRYVVGQRKYLITYKAKNVLRDYDNLELYWNVSGGDWDTVLDNVSAKISSPHAEIIDSRCFTGRVGTAAEACVSEVEEKSAYFQAESPLGPGRDLTFVLAFSEENELVTPPLTHRAWWLITANWGYLVALSPLFIVYHFWHKRGRDKRYVSDNVYFKPDNVETRTVALFERKNIPLVYHPLDGVSPSEVGTLIDDKVQINDVVAEILELARLGFLRLEKVTKDKLIGEKNEFIFVDTGKKDKKDDFNKLKHYQKLLLNEVFKEEYFSASKRLKKEYKDKQLPEKRFVFLSTLKNSFYKKLKDFKSELYERMKDEGFYEGNPEKTRVKWIVVYSIVLGVSGYLVFTSLFRIFNPYPLVLYGVSSAFGFIFAFSMPSRTPKGYSLYKQAGGLKEYLKKGKWRYEHMEKNLFVKDILPLAVSLGVVDQLANDMEELGVKPPDYTGVKTPGLFAATFNDFYSQSSTNLASSPRSSGSSWSGGSGFSGGGSAGGGFGGGGGGSW